MQTFTIIYTTPYGGEGFVYVDAQDKCDHVLMDASAELERQGFEIASIDDLTGAAKARVQ